MDRVVGVAAETCAIAFIAATMGRGGIYDLGRPQHGAMLALPDVGCRLVAMHAHASNKFLVLERGKAQEASGHVATHVRLHPNKFGETQTTAQLIRSLF